MVLIIPALILSYLALLGIYAVAYNCSTACNITGELDAGRDNLAVARQILALRIQQAQMHGYENYAQYATADTMAGSPAKVMDLLEVSVTVIAAVIFVMLLLLFFVGFVSVVIRTVSRLNFLPMQVCT